MHPLLARPERLAAYLGGWLIVGVLTAGALSRQGLALSESLVLVLPLFLIYSFICLSAWYVCRAVPLRSSRVVRVISAWTVSAAVAGGLWLGLAYAWIALLGSMPGVADATDRYSAQIPVLFTAAILLFLLALVVHYLGLAFEETRQAEQRQFALQVQKREAELRALRAQLDPHFLYNCLNSIAALTTADASGARRMCLLLGEFLRRTLHVGAQAQIWEDWADESLFWFEVHQQFMYPEARAKAAEKLSEGRPAFERVLIQGAVKRIYSKRLKAQGLGRLTPERVEQRLLGHVDTLETLLGRRKWLVGDDRTIADIAVASQLAEIASGSHLAPEIARRAKVTEWLSRN